MRARVLSATVALGSGVAAVSGCSNMVASQPVHRVITVQPGSAPRAPLSTHPPASNFRVLSPADSERLITYARDLRECLATRAVPVGPIVVTRAQIDIPATTELGGSVQNGLFGCARKIGDPASDSSLQLETSRLILYLPRQCLLDTK